MIIEILILAIVVMCFIPQGTEMKYCKFCDRMVKPIKGWSWVGFIFGFGFIYLAYYILKSTHCPICHTSELVKHSLEETL